LKSIKKLIKKAIYSNKACYLHIPKTGGTYLIQSESDNETVIAGMQSEYVNIDFAFFEIS
jgi:hypothetical protein